MSSQHLIQRILLSAATILLIVFSLHPLQAGTNIWTSIGPAAEIVNSIAVDPIAPAVIYAGTETGVFKSTNSGSSWTPINTGLPENRSITQIHIDPVTSTTLYVIISNDLYKSVNGGSSWNWTGSLQYGLHDFVITPGNPSVLYIVGNYSGVYRSTNSGATWTFAGLYQYNAYHLAVDPNAPNTVYAAGSGGIYKTTDSSASQVIWASTSPLWYVYSLVIAPTTPSTIYAGTNEGIYRSTNNGATWNLMNSLGTAVRSIVIDPTNPTTVYASIYNNWLYKSTDSGINWIPVGDDGLIWKSIQAVAAGSTSPTTLYAGVSEGDGIFVIQEINYPVPVMTSIAPSTVKSGDPLFVLTVNGNQFVAASVVKWDSTILDTTFVSNTQLTAVVPAALLLQPGQVAITVVNPAPGGGTSNALNFVIRYRHQLYLPSIIH